MPNLQDVVVEEQKAPFYKQHSQGPPKPPRDPTRLSSTSNLTASTSSLPVSKNDDAPATAVVPDFIWKAPPCRPFAPPATCKMDKRSNSAASIRRHTLQGGLRSNYDKVKMMESLGQSKKALEEGIRCIEQVDQWYKNQLDTIEDQLLIVDQIDEISDQEIVSLNLPIA